VALLLLLSPGKGNTHRNHACSCNAPYKVVSVQATNAAAGPHPAGRPAAAAATTTWQAWESVLPEWKSNKPEAAIPGNASDRTKLAAAVSTAAKTWKPPPTLSVPSLDDIGPDVPRNLHERLALVARLQLAAYLEDAGIAPTVVEFTTTDVTAALSVAGVILNDKGKRTVGWGPGSCFHGGSRPLERAAGWQGLTGRKELTMFEQRCIGGGLYRHWATSSQQQQRHAMRDIRTSAALGSPICAGLPPSHLGGGGVGRQRQSQLFTACGTHPRLWQAVTQLQTPPPSPPGRCVAGGV
jgi:hypothetical protein